MSTLAFEYRVRDPLGHVHEGQLEAENRDEAQQQLRRDGFQVLDLEESGGEINLFGGRVKRTDIVFFTNQLAVMVDTGINLSEALQGIVEQEANRSLKKILKELKKAVEEGEDFSNALAKHPKLFDRTYVSLVRASEATGSLGTMLERIASYLRKELETRSKVRSAMTYPVVMAVIAAGVTLFLLTYVLPQFMPLFHSKGMKLPKPTIVMMAISDALLHYWWAWLLGIAATISAFVYGKRTPQGRDYWDRLKINLPLFGALTRKVSISRSIRTLGTMLSSGIPMLDALKLTGQVSGNLRYEKLWNDVAERVTSGAQVYESLSGEPLFPPMLIQMIAAGERTGQLGPVLERVSDYYDHEVETAIKALTSIIEPLMITVMGVVVGGIGMALLLPIFSLSSAH